VEYDNYLQLESVRGGRNTLTLRYEDYTGHVLDRAEVLGGSTLFRTSAHPYPLEVGVPTETVTEDCHASLRMQRLGWRTAYLRVPLAAGLATERLMLHIGQRMRWGRGMIQILRIENPLTASGLGWSERLCYFMAMFHFLFPLPRFVFLTAPLGIIGASLALNLASKPFGFVALLGLIALAGMIMRNTVILVDQIETDVAHGFTRREAIVEATVRRARPVVLTALAAILAMIPLASSAFWGPMAYTIMGGLFVATFLTLLFLPALYALWFRRSLEERGGAPAPAEAPPEGVPELARFEDRRALPMAAE